MQTNKEDPPTPARVVLSDKGLARGKIGTISGAVLGVSCVAPGYVLTASIGLIVASVGLKMPAIFFAGFIPMFLTAYAYRELNRAAPDCGASFTWSTKAFGPYIGWMAGWGMVIATIIVLSNLAFVAVDFLYLFVARVVGNPVIANLPDNKLINIVTTVAFIALATAVAYRGITMTERVQTVLVSFQMLVLAGFAALAFHHVFSGNAPVNLSFSLDWFNPFSGLSMAAFVAGVTGSIFAYWGWDTCLTLGEESKDPERTPGRAGLLSVVTILITYVVVGLAVMMYAGVGETGLGLGNPDTVDNIFGVLAGPIMGYWPGMLLFLAVLASTTASLQTTFLPAARAMLAMGNYGAFPRRLASVHPRHQVPSYATVVAGIATSMFYIVTSIFSEEALYDTIAALGIMICWYYGITAFACAWYFRHEAFANVRSFVFRIAFPVIGGIMLLAVFFISVRDSLSPDYGSGATIGGIGLVFYLAFGILILGAVLMGLARVFRPEFFLGNTLPTTTSLTEPANSDDATAGDRGTGTS